MLGFIVSKVYCDYLVGAWAYSEEQQTRFWYYCYMVSLFAVLSSVGVMFRVFALTYYSWYGNKKLHEDMITRVF
jgi:hypothetical protein